MAHVKTTRTLSPKAADDRLDLLVRRLPLEPPVDRLREQCDGERGAPGVDDAHDVAAELLGGSLRGGERAGELRREVERPDPP